MSIASNLSFIENSAGAITTGTINATSAPITFSINSTENARFDSNNYLLVGYTTSQGAYRLQVNGSLYASGSIIGNITGNVTGTVTTASNIAGGTAGQIHYQSAPGLTGFAGPGTSGQLLQSNGTSAPAYVNTATLMVGISLVANTATNIAGGTAGQVPYQTAAGQTSFIGPGTAGQILVSTGASAPTYTNTASVYVQSSVYANNIIGGTTGQLVYQSGVSTTGFVGPGTTGQLLVSNGASAPTYTNTSSVQVGYSANILGGAAGSLPYQSSANTTALLGIGTNGYVLTSNGSAPTWAAVSGLSAGSATTATQINTQAQSASATYYPTFVSANNASATGMSVYTTSSFVINPTNGSGGIGNASFGFNTPNTFVTTGTYNFVVNGRPRFNGMMLGNGDGSDTATNRISFDWSSGVEAHIFAQQSVPLLFGTNNTEGMRLTSGNLLGIGTSTVATVIEAYSANSGIIRVRGGGANNQGGAFYVAKSDNSATLTAFGDYARIGGGTPDQTVSIWTGGGVPLRFDVANTERLRITINGGLAFNGSANYGSSGQILQSNGDAAPTWVNASGLSAGSSTQVQTQAQTANASYYPVFVSANNASATAMSEYTTSSFTINPATGASIYGAGAGFVDSYGTANNTYKLIAYNVATTSTGVDDVIRIVTKYNAASGASAAIGNGPAIVFAGGIGDNQTRDRARIVAVYEGSNVSGLAFHTQTNADTIAERVRIQNNGNVGMGTTTPQAKLAVSAAGAEGIEFFPASSSGVNTTQHYNRSGSSYVRNRTIASDYTFNLSGAGTDAMSLTSAGILLIAGSTAYSNAKIQLVNGDVASGSSNLSQIAFQYGSGGYTHYVQSRHDSLGTTDGNALVFNLNTGTTAGVSSAFGTGNAQSYFMGYLTHRWNTSATERLRLTANGGVSFGASGTAYGSSGQVLQSNGDAPPSWVAPSSLAAASSTQVSTQAQAASGTYYPVFVSANNASATAMSEYTTSSFFINPSTGFATVGGGGGSIAPLNVSSLAALGGTAGNFIPIFTQQSSGGTGNNVYETTWRVRASAGTDWTTNKTHNAIWVDASFTTPGTDTRCWYERHPNNGTHAWGNAATTFKFLDASGNMFLTGGSSQLNTGFTNKLNVNGSIVAGSASSTNGSIILQGQYGTGSITNFGTEYSSGGPVVGYGVYPSNAAAGAFFSSSGLALTRAAYTQAGNVHNWYVGTSQTVAVGGAVTMTNPLTLNSSGLQAISLGIGTAPSGTTGEIRATNEITAYYSDRRLKENVKVIDNAVEKVLSLNGITYTPNELAASFGYDRNVKLVGLFADEVEAVLPEATRPAPFDIGEDGKSKSGENYKTIQYEKVVPLLIEAIKEQQEQIAQLQELVKQLANK